jgi:hypothetical protein
MTKPTQPQRNWKPCLLTDPRSNQRRGGISIGKRDPNAVPLRTKLMRTPI